VNKTELTFSANDTEQQVVEISTTASTWQPAAQQTWIRATSDGGTLLLVTVDPYSDMSKPRSSTITVMAGSAPSVTISVIQEAKDTLSISSTSLTFEQNETDEKKITIRTSSTKGWELSDVPSWLNCAKNGNELIVRPIDTNNSSSERRAVIDITAGSSEVVKLTVIQRASPTFSLSPETSVALPSNQSQTTFTISSNVSWSVSSSASWLTVSPASGSNNGSVTVSASANSGSSSRSGTITFRATGFSDRTITVTQGGNQSLQVSTNSISVNNTAQTRNFSITSNVSWTVSRGTSTWFTVSPASGSNNATVNVNITANTSSSSRTGTITVSGGGRSETISVSQAAQPAPQQAQVRFRKAFSTPYITQLGVFTTGGSLLASHNFGSSSGTSSYFSITVGTHQTRYYETGTWVNSGNPLNFQANRRYTYELAREDADYWYFNTYDDGALTIQQGNMIQQGNNGNAVPLEVIAVPKNR